MLRSHRRNDCHTRAIRPRRLGLYVELLEDRTVPSATVGAEIPGQLLIGFRDGVGQPEISSIYAANGLHELRNLGGTTSLVQANADAAATLVAALGRDPRVRYIEPNRVLTIDNTPNDTSYSQLYGLNNTGQTGGTPDADIDAPEAWDIATGSSTIAVGVIDTGVDYNHPDLAANIWTNPGEIAGNGVDDDGDGYVDDIHGYDFYNNDGNPIDDNNHGTHVSGTIGAVGNNNLGVVGVNWNVTIVAIKFLGAGGSGSTAGAIASVNYATALRNLYVSSGGALGANIVLTSNSWGGGGFSTALQDAIDASGAAGMLFVAAAGNNGANNDSSPFYPASYTSANVISVAATDSTDRYASFSNWGATTVDLAAPGVSILSTTRNNTYSSFSGTSMATPHVAGAAALLWSTAPSLTAAQVKQQLLDTTDFIGNIGSNSSRPTVTNGRLNLYSALTGTPAPVVPSLSVNNVSLKEGNTGTAPATSFNFTVTLAAAATETVTVNFATANGTAVAGTDYAAGSGTLTFTPGQLTKTITVLVTGDKVKETNETFFVNLSGVSANATIGDGQGVGTIINDDKGNNGHGGPNGGGASIGGASESVSGGAIADLDLLYAMLGNGDTLDNLSGRPKRR